MKSFLVICLLLVAPHMFAQNINIIPKPNKVEVGTEVLILDKKISIQSDSKNTVNFLSSVLKSKYNISTVNKSKQNIILQIMPGFETEEYSLNISNNSILCKASTEVGLFYACQSLLQIISTKGKVIQVPFVNIEDKPLYAWRGFMLDEVRHFFGKDVVFQYLDQMAALKLNVFHWHLTDEQAWRIEIKKYPRLTEIGAKGTWGDMNAAIAFYTQEDIKEIIKYAAERHITIVPEIDMPGHASAASRAYPEISGGGTGRWMGFTFNPAKEYTYEFLDNILTEVCDLFPGKYIHIGGDEVHYGNQSWKTDPEILNFIKKNYLIDEVGLEHYFIRRICMIVNNKGKKMLGWDELINTDVTPKLASAMWWRQDKPEVLTQALNMGFDVILTPRLPCYFDFVQDSTHKIGRRWGKAFNDLETVYKFPENIEKLTSRKTKQIMGIQANIWTERIPNKNRLDFMVFPRLLAMSENAWTNRDNKNFTDFIDRLKSYLENLSALKINYYNPFNPKLSPEPWGPDKEDRIAEG